MCAMPARWSQKLSEFWKALKAWSKEHRPSDIPSHPEKTYKEAGWTNYGDFLGTGNKRGSQPGNTSRRKKK